VSSDTRSYIKRRRFTVTAPRPNRRTFMSLWQYRTEEIQADPFPNLHDFKACSSGVAAGHRALPRRRAALLAQYRTLTVPAAAAVELLAFWKRNAEQFTVTILSLTAHRVLCISVSWAQPDRDFSSVLLLRNARAPVVAKNRGDGARAIGRLGVL